MDSLVDGAWLGVEGKEMPGILLLGGKGVVLGEEEKVNLLGLDIEWQDGRTSDETNPSRLKYRLFKRG